MSDFLAGMARASRRRPLQKAEGPVAPVVPLDLSRQGFDLIAEPKLRSPASGRLAAGGDDTSRVIGLAKAFVDGGAGVISVLTEPSAFDGSLGHLAAVASSVEVPVMRKDFLVDPSQVEESREHGASGVLLVARILDPGLLIEMVEAAEALGMFSLVEVFDELDLEIASVVFDHGILLGVNSRDLADLSVDGTRFERLAPLVPAGLPLVAESGISDEDDIHRVVTLGYQVALVGTALVGVDDPGKQVERLLFAGRAVVGRRPG
jgi:indole-3-glycerol phosphate synthase